MLCQDDTSIVNIGLDLHKSSTRGFNRFFGKANFSQGFMWIWNSLVGVFISLQPLIWIISDAKNRISYIHNYIYGCSGGCLFYALLLQIAPTSELYCKICFRIFGAKLFSNILWVTNVLYSNDSAFLCWLLTLMNGGPLLIKSTDIILRKAHPPLYIVAVMVI